jgi:type VI secretion system protein ImpA
MATTLDIPSLLNPIPPAAAGDQPDDPTATPPKLGEARAAIDEARRAEDPTKYPDGDQRRNTAKKAEWPKVLEIGDNCLRGVAKDLYVASRMTEALVQLHGFPGARDGLSVMRQIVEKYWDLLYPRVDDGDMEVRAGPFNWLDSFDKGSRLASTLCLLPLISANGASIAYFNVKPPSATATPANAAEVEKTIGAASLESCEKTATELDECRLELDTLAKILDARMGKAAPGFVSIRKAVNDCLGMVKQIVERKRPPAAPKSDMAAEQSGSAPATAAASVSPAAQRADIYRQLSQAAARLRELEPHSPIPYMIERAVELGKMPFPELLKDMVREQKLLSDLYREYGVKEPTAPKK